MSQSLSIAAGGALHPVLPNIHKMLSMAALEMSLSFFPPRPPKLPAGGHLEDHCAPLGEGRLEQERQRRQLYPNPAPTASSVAVES